MSFFFFRVREWYMNSSWMVREWYVNGAWWVPERYVNGIVLSLETYVYLRPVQSLALIRALIRAYVALNIDSSVELIRSHRCTLDQNFHQTVSEIRAWIRAKKWWQEIKIRQETNKEINPIAFKCIRYYFEGNQSIEEGNSSVAITLYDRALSGNGNGNGYFRYS